MWNGLARAQVGVQVQGLTHTHDRREITWNSWRRGHSTKQCRRRRADLLQSGIRQRCAESLVGAKSNFGADEFQIQWQIPQDLFGTINCFWTNAISGKKADFISHKNPFSCRCEDDVL